MGKTLEQQYDELQEKHESLFYSTIENMELDSKKINVAIKEQMGLQVEWELFVAMSRRLREEADIEKEKYFADAISKYINHSHRSYSISEAKELAKADPKYIESRKILAKINQIHDEAKGMLDSVISRRYSLNNLSNLIIASSENIIL